MKKRCSRCRSSGFIMSYDSGVSGCEEYVDCPNCSRFVDSVDIINKEPVKISALELRQKKRRIIL